jgi:hypothetical protein
MALSCGIPQCGQCSAVGGHYQHVPGVQTVEITTDAGTFKMEGVELHVQPFQDDEAEEEYPLADWEKIAERRQDNAVVYVSGPMRGYPDHNYPAFDLAASVLRQYGYEVVNPAEHFSGRKDLDQETYLRADVGLMAERCNAIFLLPGWQNSEGARLEYAVAKALNMEIINPEIEGDETDFNLPVEYEASTIVRNGLRQQNYGHPNQDFARTAGMWTAFLAHKLKPGEVITMEEMALMMGQLKMSRLASTPGHHDSIVDLIGYAICYDRLGETE